MIVAVQPGIASTMARERASRTAIKKEFPGIRIVDKRYGSTQFAKSLQVAENMLTAHPDLDGMFASNESSTVGTVQALKPRRGQDQDGGVRLEPVAGGGRSKSGVVDSLVVQDPFRIGYEIGKVGGGEAERRHAEEGSRACRRCW